ncbi:MAG: hypothetical protein AAB557_01740 [Patescibacteria group bacterium]
MLKSIIRIAILAAIGGTIIVLLVVGFVRTDGFTNFSKIKDGLSFNEAFVPGEVLITLHPYIDVTALDEYLFKYPELNRDRKRGKTLYLPSFGTLSLKGYKQLTQKVITLKDEAKNDSDLLVAQEKLRSIYELLKSNPFLTNSNIWDTFYKNTKPEESNFSVIHYFFKPGISQADRDNFFRSYPELEIVDDRQESQTFTVFVPKGKEQYWVQQFSKQPFVKVAWLNNIIKLNKAGSEIHQMLEE